MICCDVFLVQVYGNSTLLADVSWFRDSVSNFNLTTSELSCLLKPSTLYFALSEAYLGDRSFWSWASMESRFLVISSGLMCCILGRPGCWWRCSGRLLFSSVFKTADEPLDLSLRSLFRLLANSDSSWALSWPTALTPDKWLTRCSTTLSFTLMICLWIKLLIWSR